MRSRLNDGSACLFEAGRDPDLRGFGETQLKIKPGMCFDHAKRLYYVLFNALAHFNNWGNYVCKNVITEIDINLIAIPFRDKLITEP